MISQEGPGWRLAWDPSKPKFPVLLGGDGWAFELNDEEWKSFAQLVLDLIKEHAQIQSQLMEEESITLELERNFWWGCLNGDNHNWSLQVVLHSDESKFRGIEAFWSPSSVKAFSASLRMVWDSYQ